MEKIANPNFVVKLNYQWLADMVNLNKKFAFDRDKFGDKKLLEVFNYYKGTREALSLLGSIIDNIENSLEITLFDGEDNYPLTGEIIYRANDCEISGDGDEEDDARAVEAIHKIRPLIMKEAKDTIKYYKEYFTRLYDRSRTV